jgi:hypothetical protein
VSAKWIWVKNEAVNDIPGRIPADVLPAFEARGWVECPEPIDDVEVDAPTSVDEPAPEVMPSTSGPEKENDRG